MGARRFDDLRAWQLAAELSDKVVALCATKALQTDVKFRYQLQDAAEAAPRLIAEGFGRWSPRDFARYLVMARSEVMEVISISGTYDYMLKIAATDINGYNDFVMNKLANIPNIGQYHSSIVLCEAKRETAYPIK